MPRFPHRTIALAPPSCATLVAMSIALLLTACVGEQPAQLNDTLQSDTVSSDTGCTPRCEGKQCGDDGCGGQCQPGCPAGELCDGLTDQCVCIAACGARECGADGCGGECGECGMDETCAPDGSCVPPLLGCDGAPDGSPCSEVAGGICLGGGCGESVCGDLFVNASAGEACDDGNLIPHDGCEPTCQWTCTETANCQDDGNPCNGQPLCDFGNHRCGSTEPQQATDECLTVNGQLGVCTDLGGALYCLPAGCGDSVVTGAEQCDDGNGDPGDGCEADCTFTCESEAHCDDGIFCNGVEVCGADHKCAAGAAPGCDDGNACTDDACDAALDDCVNTLIDADQDGHAPLDLGTCGTDCDDTRDDVYQGHVETCADGADNDCNGAIDDVDLSPWWPDCDGDSFASENALPVESCQEPPLNSNPCTGSDVDWTQRDPSVAGDCCDQDPDVTPNQFGWFVPKTSCGGWDYNCDGRDAQRFYKPAGTCKSSVITCEVVGNPVGWDPRAAVPECGKPGLWASNCHWVGPGACAFQFDQRLQECR